MKQFFFLSFLLATILPLTSSASSLKIAADTVAINQLAPDFHLKDLSGKEVSLSSLKGKVVVLDFWATWCVPCHENFPAMQQIVNHYKDDQNVVFLFIDTRERSADYVKLAKADMDKNHYSFKVLFDEPGEDGKLNKYYSMMGMAGIPTQFMIDAKGIIRYKFVGFDPRLTDAQKSEAAVKLIDGLKAAN